MKVTLEPTTKLIALNGMPCWIWEGETEDGIRVHFYVSEIKDDKTQGRTAEFEKQMREVQTRPKESQPPSWGYFPNVNEKL
jgi:hypothetical protein